MNTTCSPAIRSRRIAALLFFSVCAACATEGSAWREAESADTIAAYEAYSRKHPQGEHAGAARDQIKQLRWQQVRKLDQHHAYAHFRRAYPKDPLAVKASARIRELERQAALQADRDAWDETRRKNTAWAYARFLRRYPESPFAGQARSRSAALAKQHKEEVWRDLTSRNDLAAYRVFLKAHPESPHATVVKERIAKIVVDALAGGVVNAKHTTTRDPLPLSSSSGAATLIGTGTPGGGIKFVKPAGIVPPKGYVYLITTVTLKAKATIEIDLTTDVRLTVGDGRPLPTYREGQTMIINYRPAGPKRWRVGGTVRLSAGRERGVTFLHVVPVNKIASARLIVGGQDVALPDSIPTK